jgi:small subunit ribosomal protein S4
MKNQKYFSLNLLTKRSQILKKKQKKHGITMFAYYQTIRWTFRRFYGNLSEKALKKICERAYKLRGPILVNFMLMLETRLDIILYRSGFVNSIFEARQLINHGKFLVNGSVINKSSYLLKNGEILSIAPEYEQTLRQALVKRIYSKSLIFTSIPYLEINYKTLKIMFIYDLFSLNSLKYNFKLNINDLNGVLYYYY